MDGAPVAFVLGGGGVRGAVEVGMPRALLDAGIRPDLSSCSCCWPRARVPADRDAQAEWPFDWFEGIDGWVDAQDQER